MISDRQREIYARQIMLPEMGEAGQEKLLASSVLLAGTGGLGSAAALYLTAMGIGRLGLIDGDVVSLSNLNRQILYTPADVGCAKAEAAAARLQQLNPDVKLAIYPYFLTEDNAQAIISRYDLAVDCLDNFPARFILNDACLALNKPFVHAGVHHLYGQTMTVLPGKSPCLRCLFPQTVPGADDPKLKGIVGATAGVMGALEALEVYKYLRGLPVNQQGFFLFDGVELQGRQLPVAPRPDCSCQRRRA